MRLRRLFLLAFLAYVVLDLCCPLVPGAFSFDPAGSVDAVSAYRGRPPALLRTALAAPPIAVAPLPALAQTAEPADVPRVAGWCPHAARSETLAADPRPSAEDD
jgi:hypothetical protein